MGGGSGGRTHRCVVTGEGPDRPEEDRHEKGDSALVEGELLLEDDSGVAEEEGKDEGGALGSAERTRTQVNFGGCEGRV